MNDAMQRLGDEYWEYKLSVSPTTAHLMGDHRYDDRFEDLSRNAEDAEISALKDFAARARALDPRDLDVEERISREVLMFEADTSAADLEARFAEFAVNHTIGLQAMLPVLIRQLGVATTEHAEAMLAKYHNIGRAFDQATERLREGLDGGKTPIRLHVDKTIEQLDSMLAVPIDEDPMVTGAMVPPTFDETAIATWRQRLANTVERAVRPALERHRDTLRLEIMPAARSEDEPGLGWIPGGDEAYRRAIHRHTSLLLDADEVHGIGLETIDALAAEYRTLGKEVLGTEDLDEIFTRLRDDPALHFTSGADVAAASEEAMARAKQAMGDWFGRLPKADCVVMETPSGPTAFYYPPAEDGSRPGTFFVNTADPTRWGRFEIEAMAFHEGIPGHHLQLAISQELDDQPMFRKHARITAYAEGWGLYTERLADEMGLYSGPMERIGMLSADSMRAGRLVVDTGLHAMGWTRQQAIDYFAANSPMSLGTIEGEVDRYIGMPGQALAYMIGRKEIMRMRAAAKKRLGSAFDIKGFHDEVLGHGLLPLPTLDRVIHSWAASQESE